MEREAARVSAAGTRQLMGHELLSIGKDPQAMSAAIYGVAADGAV